jgi:hypothetical protein
VYIVEIENNGVKTTIHGQRQKLKSGKVVKGLNCIDSFSFTMLLANIGFDSIRDFLTLVSVYNTARNRYEFRGRVLYQSVSMSESGLITKEVTCESYFGFLCDSQQKYVDTKNWTVLGLLNHIIDTHNAQVEEYKRFRIGEVTVADSNDNIYVGIQRDNSWKTLEEKLLKTLGGEIRFRVTDDATYLDWLTEIGETKETEIALSRNMKSITKESDPSAYVTRLIPLGSKLKSKDTDGNETESDERIDITSVNNGVNYIDDTEAIAAYGIHVGYVEWDDVTEPSNLLRKGREWLESNNKVQVKYSVSALDLSLLGLDIDDFDVGNSHPIINPLLGVDDVAKIIKKTVDICEEIKSTIEIGDNFKTLSDMQLEQISSVSNLSSSISKYATSQQLSEKTKELWNAIASTESGAFGAWSYEKSADGSCDLWGAFLVSNIECATAFGSLFRTADIAVDALPFTTTSAQVVASYEGNGILCAALPQDGEVLPKYYLVLPESATIESGKITVHIHGAWK